MKNVNYKLIGTVPSVEKYRDTLPALIAEYKAISALKPREQMTMDEIIDQGARGVLIEQCAEHFYGLSIVNCTSMLELIDEIEGAEQELELS
jgi:hypothetical protein